MIELARTFPWVAAAAYFHTTLSLLALALSFGVILAYVRILPRERGMVRFFALSQVLIFGAYAARAVFWSLRSLYRLEAEAAYAPSAWFLSVNMTFNVVVIVACYAALQAVYRMIPARDRSRWTWMSAPLYPPWSLVDYIRNLIGPKVVDRRISRRHDTGERRRMEDRQ